MSSPEFEPLIDPDDSPSEPEKPEPKVDPDNPLDPPEDTEDRACSGRDGAGTSTSIRIVP
jgi:hypothetical protein